MIRCKRGCLRVTNARRAEGWRWHWRTGWRCPEHAGEVSDAAKPTAGNAG